MKPEQAKAVLENPAFEEAFAGVRTAILSSIERCSLKDVETAEDLRRCLKLLKDVKTHFVACLNDGKLQEFRTAQQEQAKKNPFRNYFR